MGREERLSRQRERDRARGLRETVQERKMRLARRREYERTNEKPTLRCYTPTMKRKVVMNCSFDLSVLVKQHQ